MDSMLVILAFLLFIAGLLGAIIPVLPGPPLSFAGLLLLRWSGHPDFSPAFLWIWAGITAIVTVMDYFLPTLMTKQFGGSRAASIGSILGLLAGIFLFPPWGMVLGPFFGAFTGELIHNRINGAKAFKVALGAFFAFIVGSGAKLIVSSIMLYYAVKAMF
jgi:uncharacterized protein YqgC (DUF456 family)